MSVTRIATGLVLSILLCPLASAEPGPYALMSIGQTSIDARASRLDAELLDIGFSSARTSVDETSTGIRMFGGYRFNQYFAVEGGYLDFGETTLNATTTGPPATAYQETDASGFSVQAVGNWPITERIGVHAKLGGVYWNARAKFRVALDGAPWDAWSENESGSDWVYGLGVNAAINEHLSMRLEYEVYRNVGEPSKTGQSDVDFVSAGLVVYF